MSNAARVLGAALEAARYEPVARRAASASPRRWPQAPERWRHLVRHADDARVYEQIWDDEDVNAWVICWSEDQDTGFHDHDESGGRDRRRLRAACARTG